MHVRTAIFPLINCAALTICAQTTAAQAPSVRDSAGVRVVTYSAFDTSRVAYRLSAAPLMEFGGSADGSDYMNGISDAQLLTDGNVALALATQIIILDESGRRRATLGRAGKGPGEYQVINSLCVLRGDTLVAFDSPGGMRLTKLDRSGKILATSTLTGSLIGCLPDGSLVVSGSPANESERRSGPYPVRALRRFSFTNEVAPLNNVAFARGDTGSLRVRRPNASGSGFFFTTATYPFRRIISTGIAGSTIFVAENFTYEVRTHAPDGKLLSILRGPAPRVAVTAAIKAAHIEDLRSRLTEQGFAALTSDIELVGYPRFLPPHGRVVGDDKGRIWVQDYPVPGVAKVRWNLFDASRAHLGAVYIPAALTIQSISGDKLIASTTDSDGVRLLRVYGLNRAN